MKKLTKSDYEEYSRTALKKYQHELNSNSDNKVNLSSIGGTSSKKFIRVDSEFVKGYYDARSKANSSFVSYADDLILEYFDPDYRDEYGKKKYPLKYISCLLKNSSMHTIPYGAQNEVVGCRLANLFGMPTVYNEMVEYLGNEFVLSIDVLKDDEHMLNLEDMYTSKYSNIDEYDLDDSFNMFTYTALWSEFVHECIDHQLSKDAPDREEQIDLCIESFLEQLFFHMFMINNRDIKPQNFAAIFNGDNTTAEMFPSFDYEFSDFKPVAINLYFELLQDYLHFMNENYPGKLKEIMFKFKKMNFTKDGKLNLTRPNKIFRDTFPQEYINSIYMDDYKNNVTKINFMMNKFMENPEVVYPVRQLRNEYLSQNSEHFLD